ncbi:MAG: virulence factor [Hyphomicrobiales bacterium]|nr:virulence factor [Hyphomicrobiales bacterium]MDE2017440.1 virulence factor [Hyphomicrobiales bacterium]
MAELVVVLWRDIPTQVIARAGRKTAKRELPARFMVAVDAAAMASGARDDDAYLADWRRAGPTPCGDDLEAEAEAAAARLDASLPPEALAALVRAGGRAA